MRGEAIKPESPALVTPRGLPCGAGEVRGNGDTTKLYEMTMTIPTQHNCSHQGEGWCLNCVQALSRELDTARESCREMVAAMRRYEMDVEENPPHDHREMMARAAKVVEPTVPGTAARGGAGR